MDFQIMQIVPPSKNLRESYRKLVADIDAMVGKFTANRFQAILQCRPGCADCCMQFSVLPLEAAFIIEVLHAQTLNMPMRYAGDKKCLLLLDNLCQVYDARPVICRTQGLALGYIDEDAGTIEVSACPLNFPEDYPLSHDDLLYMDQFNSRLAELNLQYCQDTGLDPEKRIPLGAVAAA